jgi:hypothetical protein
MVATQLGESSPAIREHFLYVLKGREDPDARKRMLDTS